MQIISKNESLDSFITKVTQPTEDAILYDRNGFQLLWDATAKWFKWIPATIQNYDTNYLTVNSTMTAALDGISPPVNKRDTATRAPIWINSDPTVAPTSVLTTASDASIEGTIKCLQSDLKADCDLIYRIQVNINSSDGTAAGATADSFITSIVQIANWT